MNTQHTPGPWRLGFDPSRAHDDETTVWAGTEAIGNAITKEPQLHIPHIKQAHANARLMAAAPDLLEALQGMIEVWGLAGYPHIQKLESARAAIAKATQP